MNYTIYYFLGLILMIFVLGYLVEYVLSYVFSQHIFRIFVGPGIILHESAHALVARLFGGKVVEFKIFDEKGGSVKYTQPRFSNFTNILVGLAPIIIAIAILFLITKLFHFDFILDQNQVLTFKQFKSFFFDLNYHSAKTYIFIYLSLSIAAAMVPSKQDMSLSWAGLGLFAVISILLFFWIPITGRFFLVLLPPLFWAVNLLIITLIVSTFLYLIKFLFVLAITRYQENH